MRDDERKLTDRQEFILISFGEASAIKGLLERTGLQFQPVALNNQFVKTEATPEEIQEIRALYSNASMEMAKLMDRLNEFEERGFDGTANAS